MTKYGVRMAGIDGHVVLAACTDPHKEGGGGLFSFDGNCIERIEPMDCNSLTVAEGRLLLMRWSRPGESIGVFVYDERGVERYYRFDGLGGAHQIAWDGKHFVLVSTATNSVLWIDAHGNKSEWRAPGEGDCWHINGIFLDGADVYLSAFGRFAVHRGWEGNQTSGRGIIFNQLTGENVVTGLNCPHHPKFLNGCWIVCNSAAHQVLEIEQQTGRIAHSVQLHGWTRGLALSDEWIFAGVSMPRHDPTIRAEKASIVIISRATWKVEHQFPIESPEIGDLAIVPQALAIGVRKGLSQR
jgi:acetolactate synthase I/II/III large subunit